MSKKILNRIEKLYNSLRPVQQSIAHLEEHNANCGLLYHQHRKLQQIYENKKYEIDESGRVHALGASPPENSVVVNVRLPTPLSNKILALLKEKWKMRIAYLCPGFHEVAYIADLRFDAPLAEHEFLRALKWCQQVLRESRIQEDDLLQAILHSVNTTGLTPNASELEKFERQKIKYESRLAMVFHHWRKIRDNNIQDSPAAAYIFSHMMKCLCHPGFCHCQLLSVNSVILHRNIGPL